MLMPEVREPCAEQARALVSDYPCHVSDRWREGGCMTGTMGHTNWNGKTMKHGCALSLAILFL